MICRNQSDVRKCYQFQTPLILKYHRGRCTYFKRRKVSGSLFRTNNILTRSTNKLSFYGHYIQYIKFLLTYLIPLLLLDKVLSKIFIVENRLVILNFILSGIVIN